MEHLELSVELGFLAEIATVLGVDHGLPASADFLAGQEDLRVASARWRELALAVERTSSKLLSGLGEIDAAWQGEAATAFGERMGALGRAGHALVDVLRKLATSLEHAAEALRIHSRDLRELVANAVEEIQDQLPDSPGGARQTLACLAEPAHQIVAAVADSHRNLAQSCESLVGDQAAALPALAWLTGHDRTRTRSRRIRTAVDNDVVGDTGSTQ